jgi:hypothetical protein
MPPMALAGLDAAWLRRAAREPVRRALAKAPKAGAPQRGPPGSQAKAGSSAGRGRRPSRGASDHASGSSSSDSSQPSCSDGDGKGGGGGGGDDGDEPSGSIGGGGGRASRALGSAGKRHKVQSGGQAQAGAAVGTPAKFVLDPSTVPTEEVRGHMGR